MKKLYKNKKKLIENFINQKDVVLDIGFWGQAVKKEGKDWPHNTLKENAKSVYGVDIDFDESKLENPGNYKKQSAEDFNFDKKFDVVFAGDLIEHLSNPGFFLECSKKHLKEKGRLIITTPNCFNLFNILQKIFKNEPPINADHTFYFNLSTLSKLLEKNNFEIIEYGYIDFPDTSRLGWKRVVLKVLNKITSLFTYKFKETLFIVAK